MKTLSFNKIGNPKDVLTLVEKEIPVPSDNEILVKVLGSPIHPADVMFIEGSNPYNREFPQTAGLEGGGIIKAAGKNVPDVIGKLVAFEAWGAWAEYVIVSKDSFVILPDDFPAEKAAQFFLNPFTAWGLLKQSKAKTNDWLLLTASNSLVSRIVIQLAKPRAIKVIAVVRDLKQTDDLKTLGAEAVIDVDDQYFLEQIDAITVGKGVNVAFDAVGGITGTKILQTLALNGRVLLYGLLSNDPVHFYNAQVVFKNLEIKGYDVRSFLQNLTKEQKDEMMQTLIEEIAKPSFELSVAKTFTLEQFKEALLANEQSGKKGKIVFKN